MTSREEAEIVAIVIGDLINRLRKQVAIYVPGCTPDRLTGAGIDIVTTALTATLARLAIMWGLEEEMIVGSVRLSFESMTERHDGNPCQSKAVCCVQLSA